MLPSAPDVPDPDHDPDELDDESAANWLEVRDSSARAAGMLIDALKEKGRDSGGQVNRRQFVEALHELGVEMDRADSTDALFASLDTDRSGTLDLGELQAAISLILDPAADMTFDKMLMSEGSILAPSIQRLRDRLTEQASRIRDLFRRWDKNGDSLITKDEFRLALPELGLDNVLPSQFDELFASFDSDRSGAISFRELNRMLKHDPDSKSRHGGGKGSSPKSERANGNSMCVDLPELRKQTKIDMLKLGAQAALRSAVRPDEEWARLGFDVSGPGADGDPDADGEEMPTPSKAKLTGGTGSLSNIL